MTARDNNAMRASRWRRFVRWLPAGLALVVFSGLLVWLFLDLRNTIWCYYTDDISIRRDASDADLRFVLWEDPYPAFGEFNAPAELHDAAFSPDGTRLVFTRGAVTATNADLHSATWDGLAWTEDGPIEALNTESNEISPHLARHDGTLLYFVSDRPGGLGGTDLWLARWDGKQWAGITNLGPSVNSPYNETGPCLSPAGDRLLFSSDRPMTDAEKESRASWFGRAPDSVGFDIFSAAVRVAAPATNGTAPAFPRPVFSDVGRVGILGSLGDDLEPVFSRRGDYLYFASDRDGGQGRFDLYEARVLDGIIHEPENLGVEINGPGDERSPAVRMEGFDILFSSNRGGTDLDRFRLHASTMREVVLKVDLSRWHRLMELLDRIKWWLLAIPLLLALLYYLIKHWRDLTSLFHKCLAVSAILHLIALLLFAMWQIRQAMEGMQPKTMELAIDVDALAKEKLALDMHEDVAELPPSEVTVAVEQTREPVPMPRFTPQEQIPAPPIVTRSSDESFVHHVTPSKARDAMEVAAAKQLDVLPEMEIPDVEIVMEVPEAPPEKQPTETTKETLDPTFVQKRIELAMAKYAKPATRAVTTAANVSDVVNAATNAAAGGSKVRDTGGTIVVASAGMESKGQLPEMKGTGDIVGLLIKHPGTGRSLKFNAPGKFDIPAGRGTSISPQIFKNPGRLSTEIVESLGGSAETQGCIGRALDWFSKTQEPDGRWDIKKHGGEEGHDVAATSLALLCYYGWGAKHNEKGPYRDTVRKAVDWLANEVKDDGDLRGKAREGRPKTGTMYDHAMGAMALSEAYGLTKDEALREPAQKAIEFLVKAQNEQNGGWRYTPGAGDGDTSVFGWQYMALKSAELAGLEVPKGTFERADKWLARVSGGKQGGITGYQKSETGRPAMIATAMFCRQLAMTPPTDPRMQESALYMRGRPLPEKDLEYYYLYYGTLSLYQHQGEIWEDWNNRMKDVLTASQQKTGSNVGSWDASSWTGPRMGRAVTTAFATLSLEVYYRILPIYGYRGDEDTE